MFKIMISLFVPFIFMPFIRSQYAIIQAEHYEIYRYLKHDLKQKLMIQSVLIGLLLIINNSGIVSNLIVFILSLAINFSMLNKHVIKYTPRVKRFFTIAYIETFFMFFLIPFNGLISLIIVNNLILFIMLSSHVLSMVIEHLLMKKYIKEAKTIVKNKIVVGVTGSYGKTSCKNIIYDLLEGICNVSKTPKSYNTKVGIVKSIRDNVGQFDDIFICEYGVDKKGGMDKLLKIVKPSVSLITEVGPQHLLTFKNINNILNEKIKLATVLNCNETAVINNDNIYLRETIKELKCKVITYGINVNSYIMGKNIKVTNKGITFDLYIDGKNIETLNCGLLGIHSVYNVLGAIGVILGLNIELKEVFKYFHNIKTITHRLELKKIDEVMVIDDSFNSNEIGFKNAIDILSLMNEEKIVVTPGVIEQGENSDRINYELGKYMADKIDMAILVEKNATIIKEGLLAGGFNEEKIIVKKDFKDSWKVIKTMENKNEKIVLIENDLPSIYLK